MWAQASASVAASDPSTAAQPSGPSDLNTLGVTAARRGQFELGVDYLRKALQANPGDALLRKNLSGILTDWASQREQAGDVERAEQLLLEAIAHDGDNSAALARLGDLCYFKRSDFTQAIEYWKRAYGKLPTAE